MSLEASQVQAMDAAGELLARDLGAFSTTLAVQSSGWKGIGNWFEEKLADNTSGEAASHALAQWEAQTDDLRNRQYAQVVAGSQSFDGWMGTARALHQAITSTTDDTDGWSFQGVLTATTTATVAEVKKDVAVGALIGLPLLIAVGALYFLLIFGRRG